MNGSRLALIRRSLTTAKVLAVLVLIEQGLEALLLGVSLAEHPTVVVACLGALAAPLPKEGAA